MHLLLVAMPGYFTDLGLFWAFGSYFLFSLVWNTLNRNTETGIKVWVKVKGHSFGCFGPTMQCHHGRVDGGQAQQASHGFSFGWVEL